MSDLNNSVTAIGRLGQDPDVRYNDNGSVVANFSIAISESRKDSEGEWKESTTWMPLNAWGDLAKKVEVILKQGDEIIIKGKYACDQWTDKDQKKHSKTYVRLLEFKKLASKPRSTNNDMSKM